MKGKKLLKIEVVLNITMVVARCCCPDAMDYTDCKKKREKKEKLKREDLEEGGFINCARVTTGLGWTDELGLIKFLQDF